MLTTPIQQEMRRCIARLAVAFGLLFGFTSYTLGAWPGVPFEEVRAFAWKLDRNEETVIGPGIVVAPRPLNPKGTLLSKAQIASLIAAQARRRTERPQAGCYVPHNAFVFYDAHKKPVAFLEICFDCLGSRLSPEDANCDPDFIALAQLCSELKLPFGRHKTFRQFREETAAILGVSPAAQ